MSADNWTYCPRCHAKALEAFNKIKLDAVAAYGKVGPEQYLSMLEKADKPFEPEATLREDYQIGVGSNGEFEIAYGCSCDKCGFSFSHKHKQQVWPETTASCKKGKG